MRRSSTPNSRPSRATVAPTSTQRRSSTSAASGGCAAITTCAPSKTIPAFSVAISASVVPSSGTWSSPTGSRTQVPACTTLVASQLPPSPTSSTATSTGASANAAKAIPVSTSKNVIGTDERASTSCTSGSTSSKTAAKRSSVSGTPSTAIRSFGVCRCGLVYRPVRSPKTRSRPSTIRAVLVLPFVPVRWIAG